MKENMLIEIYRKFHDKICEKYLKKLPEKKFLVIGVALLFAGAGGGISTLMNSFATVEKVEIVEKEKKYLPNDILNIIAKQIEDKKQIDYVPVDLNQWVPSPVFLNLSTKFPEGADPADPTQSHAGLIFKELLNTEGEWYSQVLSDLDDKPEEMAKRLGKPISVLDGKYNVTDKEQDPFKKETWIVKKWDDVRVNVLDANGVSLDTNSNLKEIMAMANVYGYYHNWEDEELYLNYAKHLLEKSRSYAFSMSDISFEKEILTDEEIAKARSQGNGQALVDFFASRTLQSTEKAGEGFGNDQSATVADATTSAETGVQHETGVDGGPGVKKATPSEAVAANADESLTNDSASDAAASDSVDVSSEAAASAETFVLKEFETDAQGNVVFPKKTGKLDLSLTLTVYKLSGKNSLYSIDDIGNRQDEFNDDWQGWTADKTALVDELMNKNWYAEFGISSNAFSTAKSLSKQKIDEYMAALPSDTSDVRKVVIEKALHSVGYIPYYFGGKPISAEFDNNRFYNIIAPDYKGRVFRGLDCSGWVNYVLWSATGNRPGAASTGEFLSAGRAVDRASLKPGDVLVRGGTEETIGHIVMFLKWNPDGSMKVIEETGFPQNNVTISDTDITWSCRNLLD